MARQDRKMPSTYQASVIAVVSLLLALVLDTLNNMRYTRPFIPHNFDRIFFSQIYIPTCRVTATTVANIPYLSCQLTSPSPTNNNRMASTKSFAEAVKDRRTYYALINESTIPDSRIQEIVKDAILHTPSAFNSQTSRAVVLLGEEHVKTWDLIAEVYKQQLPEEKFNRANERFKGFRAAYGTVRQRQTKLKATAD